MSDTFNSPTPTGRLHATLSIDVGSHSISLKTGGIACYTTTTVEVRSGDTVVLVPLVVMPTASETDFLPLSVHYSKRKYADGQIPGARDRREGRPTNAEALVSRLIDRPLRAVFSAGFDHEVQISSIVLSSDPNIRSDILALLGASTAVALSGLPCEGPVAGVRVGYINDSFILNPNQDEIDQSSLDLVVAGTEKAILMVEGQANALKKELIVEAILFAHERIKSIAHMIKEFAEKADKPMYNWKPIISDSELMQKVKELLKEELQTLDQIEDKEERKAKRESLHERLFSTLLNEKEGVRKYHLALLFKKLEMQPIRENILKYKKRLDGRDARTIRPISIETGLLPRVHGSVLFTRGETQALVTATLGSERDAEITEGIDGVTRRDTFILHYNFPPYCVGEVGQVGSPKRREIGHANLAKRAMQAVLPDERACPYVLRVVSEIMSANGSSSMATVCGTSLALMDAGIPLKAQVAGIAMGLVKQGEEFVVLSDISEVEDHIGDMDLKVTGTREGITAVQMDIKTDGITREILDEALNQAHEGIKEILDKMEAAIPVPRQKVSPYAPQIMEVNIPIDKIQVLIGKGGTTIRSITDETGTLIDIHRETGLVRVSSSNVVDCEQAIRRIKELTEAQGEAQVGMIYEGTVFKLLPTGAIVSILPGCRGFVHISEVILEHPDQAIHEVLQEKQKIRVKVSEINRQKNKIKLTMKGVVVEELKGAEIIS